MKKVFMFFKKKKSWPQLVWKLVRANYFISIIAVIILFVGLIAAYKLLSSEDEYIYAKIKISQGLWWANTAKPAVWMVDAIKKGDVEVSLSGKPMIEVLEVRNYPWWSSDEYVVYIDAKIKVSKNKKTDTYSFKRVTIGVGSPIDLELPSVQTSGTIIEMSEKPFLKNKLIKNITFVKKWAEPWEFDAIQVGDTYNNGEEDVFEILDKKIANAQAEYMPKLGYNYPTYSESKVHITVTAKVLVREENNNIIFGEDQILRLGKGLNLATNKYAFTDYFISDIQ